MECLISTSWASPCGCGSHSWQLSSASLVLDLGLLHKNPEKSASAKAAHDRLLHRHRPRLWRLDLYRSGEKAATGISDGLRGRKVLAMDNIFVIAMIFSYFAIPRNTSIACCSTASSACMILRGIMIAGGAGGRAEFPLGALSLRRLPGHHRHQDAVDRPTSEHDVANSPVLQVPAQRFAGDRRAARREVLRPADRSRRRQARPSSRRCFWR